MFVFVSIRYIPIRCTFPRPAAYQPKVTAQILLIWENVAKVTLMCFAVWWLQSANCASRLCDFEKLKCCGVAPYTNTAVRADNAEKPAGVRLETSRRAKLRFYGGI